jgi:hypothetical protein
MLEMRCGRKTISQRGHRRVGSYGKAGEGKCIIIYQAYGSALGVIERTWASLLAELSTFNVSIFFPGHSDRVLIHCLSDHYSVL